MRWTLLALTCAGAALGADAPAPADIEAYDIGPAHKRGGFTLGHFVAAVPEFFGRFRELIVVDHDHLKNSSMEASIEAPGVTNNPHARHDNQRYADLFAVVEFPAMGIRSKSSRSTGGDKYTGTGYITTNCVMNKLVTAVEVLGAIPEMKGPALPGLDV